MWLEVDGQGRQKRLHDGRNRSAGDHQRGHLSRRCRGRQLRYYQVRIIRSVQYRSTGVSLQVTPSVHAQGVVSLEITQEVSEAQANNTSDISSPIILNRSITTEVVAGDGQTVLLAGLIKENQSRTVTGIPFLSNIPLLGHLFKTTSNGSDRTELVIMITPHIIRSTQQIDETNIKNMEEHKGDATFKT